MPSEADTCRRHVVPALQRAGWEAEPHFIAEQRTITDGRIIPVGRGFVRKPPKRADFLLFYERGFPLGVVESKAEWRTAGDGLQQAKEYAEMLALPFAHATNGPEILEFDYPTFRVDEARCDSRYLCKYLSTPSGREQLTRISPGSAGRNRVLSLKRLNEVEIPLPPLAEQRRIVARIEALAAQIDEAKRLRQESVEEAEAMVASHAGALFSSLGELYPVNEFGSYDPHVTSGPRNWSKHYDQNGLRFYRAQDIGPEGAVLDDGKVFITPPPGNQGRSAMLRTGDLMLVITGATVGRANVYRHGLEPGFVSQHVAICRLPPDKINPEYALHGLRSPLGQEQLLGQRYGQGKPGLNLTNIRALSLPLPPLPEQRRIVAELDALQSQVDGLKRLQAGAAAELDALLPAILDRAFKGEL